MRSAFVLPIFVLVVVLVQVSLAQKCKGHELKLSEDQLDMMKKCVAAKPLDDPNMNCLIKCVMQGMGLFDAQGVSHKEAIMQYVIMTSSVPQETKDAYKAAMEKCVDDHGKNIDIKDPKCSAFGPMALCVAQAFDQVCLAA